MYRQLTCLSQCELWLTLSGLPAAKPGLVRDLTVFSSPNVQKPAARAIEEARNSPAVNGPLKGYAIEFK